MVRSPFYVVQEFLSNKQCEDLISRFEIKTPNKDIDGENVKLERLINPHEGQDLILNKLYLHIAEIEKRYECLYKSTEQLQIIHYPENDKKPAEEIHCESAKFVKKKWVKIKDVDLTGFIWLKDYNSSPPLDPRFEVYGAKIEFPAYNFSLTPQRGTLILFPAGPHFINAISPVAIGDMYQIKINLSITDQDENIWFYDPSKFPCGTQGFLQGWFEEFI